MTITQQTNDILTWLLRLEDATLSGKVVNLGDGAGWTRLGITSRDASFFHDDFRDYSVDAAIEAAKVFYYQKFWLPLELDAIDPNYAASILSCAVNCGIEPAKALFARSNSHAEFIVNWQAHYHAIVKMWPQDAKFLDGWLRRAITIFPELL